MTRRGFSMIEVLTVLGILSILSGFALLGSQSVRASIIRSTVKTDMVKLTAACKDYKTQFGKYPVPQCPASCGQFGVLLDSVVHCEVTVNGYGEYVDPWGTPYFYYPIPVGFRKPYTNEENWALSNPGMTGGNWYNWSSSIPVNDNKAMATQWRKDGMKTKYVDVLLISAGPDKAFTMPWVNAAMQYDLMNSDDIFNYYELSNR